jgi:diguanylate cyclase (GGDEF)-like protein
MENSYLVRILLLIGSSSELDTEEKCRRISLVFFMLICMIAFLSFSIYHYFAGNFSIFILDLIALLFSLTAVAYIRNKKNAPVIYWIISLFCVAVSGVIVSIDRSEIFYLFWPFLLPPIVFSLLGQKSGLAVNMASLIVNLFLMSFTGTIFATAPYSASVIVRYSIIYAILTLFTYILEMTKQILINSINKEKEKFEKASRHDSLTGLSNRMDILIKINNEKERQQRQDNPFSLIICDIDNFKDINDNYGHDSGDFVLKKTAGILKDQVRGIDHPSRMGGDEFLIMLVETDITDGFKVAERIRKEIESEVFSYRHANFHITMTFGICECRKSDNNINECIKRADQALYEGKKQGKNIVVKSDLLLPGIII